MEVLPYKTEDEWELLPYKTEDEWKCCFIRQRMNESVAL